VLAEFRTNIFVVGHLGNITIAANATMEEAEAAIFLPSESRSTTRLRSRRMEMGRRWSRR
jgi:hypothetical protein